MATRPPKKEAMQQLPRTRATVKMMKPGRGLRAWVGLFLQERREKRAGGSPQVPAAPTNLVAGVNVTLVVLTWDGVSGDVLGLNIYRQTDGGGYGLWQSLDPGSTGTEDGDGVAGHSYNYYLTAFNAVGESAPSNDVYVLL
jgi:hypothetical protein